MQAFTLKNVDGVGTLVSVQLDKPEPGAGEVRIKVEAVSVNYRDLLILGAAGHGGLDGRIPLSDGAGVVDAIGDGVDSWKVGDRVAASFIPDWIEGPFKAPYMASALGGPTADGMLAEYVVLPATALVAVPAHLSMAEAATLPCAAVTAWHGLLVRGGLSAGDTLLVQGTGGVALFALQFATAVGARAIVLSSSNEKLERAKALGASILINYRETPEWDVAVMAATDGQGASHILELGGPDTYDRSVRSVASAGKIVQIGVLTGFTPKPDLARIQAENVDIIGVTVGSVEHFKTLNAFIEANDIKPVIDKTFGFDQVAEAFAHMQSATHFGKIVVTL